MIPISLATKSKWLLSNNLSGQPADDIHIMSLCFHLLLILINVHIQNLYASQNKKDIGSRSEYQGSAYQTWGKHLAVEALLQALEKCLSTNTSTNKVNASSTKCSTIKMLDITI